MNNSDTTSPDGTPSLHELLNEHSQTCSECQKSQESKPKGLGQTSQLCSEYQLIIGMWAEREGRVNNIVDHDEYGNYADPEFYDKGGTIK